MTIAETLSSLPSPTALLRYSRKDAARILRVPVQQIAAWQRAGLLPAEHGFAFLSGVRQLRDLRRSRISAKSLRSSVEVMRRTLGVKEPLQSAAARTGTHLTFRYAGALLDPLTQQFGFGFEAAASATDPVLLRREAKRPDEANAFAQAQELFQQAVQLEERSSTVAAAADLYREVLALWPAHAPASVNLGTILYNQRRYAEAEAQYRLAAEIDPDYALAFFDLGNVLDELQRLPEAVDAYSRAIQLVPQYADAHYNLALAYERLGQRRRALRHWMVYTRLDPKGPWAAHARAQAKKTLASERLSIVSRHGRLAG